MNNNALLELVTSDYGEYQEHLSGSAVNNLQDHFLFAAMRPMCYTNYLEQACSNLLYECYNESRRKMASVSRQKLLDNLFTSIVIPDRKRALSFLKKCKFNRDILAAVVDNFSSITESYLLYERKSCTNKKYEYELHNIEQSLGANNKNLSAVIRWVNKQQQLYSDFRALMIGKYIRQAYKEAKISVNNTQLHIDIQDLFKNLVYAVGMALDRYDSDKGALASHIANWMLNIKTNTKFGHHYGQSLKISAKVRRSLGKIGQLNSFSRDLQDLDKQQNNDHNSFEDLLHAQHSEKSIVSLFSKIPELKLLRLVMALPYIPTDQDKQSQIVLET